jgi:hypothetical protein
MAVRRETPAENGEQHGWGTGFTERTVAADGALGNCG